jgi:outer membrane porin, OprD family
MKKSIILVIALAICPWTFAESIMKPVNDLGLGTVSGRAQYFGMHRYFEGNNPENANSHTFGIRISYHSPEMAGFDFAATYDYAGVIAASESSNDGNTLLSNGKINVLNEAYLRYKLGILNLPGTAVVVGRRVSHGEVFRSDEFRQKPRSLEGIQLESTDIPGTSIIVGHVRKLSNVWDTGDRWKFNNMGHVFGTPENTDGITWFEMVNKSVDNLELAFFDAYAYDVRNLIGTRLRYSFSDRTAVNGYYRHESSVGSAPEATSDMYSFSLQQKAGRFTLEPGYFGVRGSSLRFQEVTTGINHPLGISLMIYPGMFNGDSDTVYLKGGTKVGKTTLYFLYHATWQDKSSFEDAQELDFVAKYPLVDNLAIALKVGVGQRDKVDDTIATDTRLFLTYSF